MCEWKQIRYTCGCVKNMEFVQCAERRGTNVKCKPIRKRVKRASANYCPGHLVNPTAPQKYYSDQ